MKRSVVILLFLACANLFGQGIFNFYNARVPTRLWSADGPFAGPGIWAQTLAGPDIGSLEPVGVPVEHVPGGWVFDASVVVPSVPPGEVASVQMVAWDGRIWGTSLAGVPESQLGRTDVIRVGLADYVVYPVATTLFSQPAIVPIPEPSVWVLGMCGFGLLAVGSCLRHGLSGCHERVQFGAKRVHAGMPLAKTAFGIGLILGGLVHAGFSQGYIDMNTIGGSSVMRFSNAVTRTWAYEGVVVGLYWGPDRDSVTNVVLPLAGLQDPMRPELNGYVSPFSGGGSRSIPSRAGYETWFQLKVWSSGFGSWEEAWSSNLPGVLATGPGQTPLAKATPAITSLPTRIPWGGTAANPIIVEVSLVPEPSVWVLGMVGCGLLVVAFRFRRWMD